MGRLGQLPSCAMTTFLQKNHPLTGCENPYSKNNWVALHVLLTYIFPCFLRFQHFTSRSNTLFFIVYFPYWSHGPVKFLPFGLSWGFTSLRILEWEKVHHLPTTDDPGAFGLWRIANIRSCWNECLGSILFCPVLAWAEVFGAWITRRKCSHMK